MSPAPQGGLEVERYIGSCLISQSSHRPSPGHKPNKSPAVRPFLLNGGGPRYPVHPPLPAEFYPQHGWAGMPLFCMAGNGQRRHRKGPRPPPPPQQHRANRCAPDAHEPDDLSRLAVHTQGVPLIRAGRYKSGFNANRSGPPPPLRLYRGGGGGEAAVARRSGPAKNASDKEPGPCDSVSVASDESSTNSENSLPRIIKPRKRRKKDRKLPPPPQPGKAGAEPSTPQPSRGVEEEEKSAVSVKTASEPDECAVEPDEALALECGDDLPQEADGEEPDEQTASSCQCRYCDPAGVIWDVDQRCYSPFLTPPSPTEPGLSSYAFRGYEPGPALRRSWSEPSPAPQVQPRTRASSESQPVGHQSLEVSSEIVTSPNGHRDIEIKFFSLKSNGAGQYRAEE